jgi:hypothetical protein
MVCLVAPLAPVDPAVRHGLETTIERFHAATHIETMPEAVFEAHRHLACRDRDVTRLLLGAHFAPTACREYDVDVCAWMIASQGLSYTAWLRDFPRWRDLRLLFPMILASQHMPSLSHWLPSEVHATPVAQCLSRCLATLPHAATFSTADLEGLAAAWRVDQSGAAQLLGGTIDRVAVLMRVQWPCR